MALDVISEIGVGEVSVPLANSNYSGLDNWKDRQVVPTYQIQTRLQNNSSTLHPNSFMKTGNLKKI